MKLPWRLIFFLLWVPFLCPAQTSPVLWSVHLADYTCKSSPAVAPDGTIYAGTFDGYLFAIASDGKVNWKFNTGLEIKSSPAVGADGTIYFGCRDRKLYAVTPAGGLKWAFATGAWVDSSPAIAADGTIYFGSWDTNLYALNPDGSLKWRFPSGGIIDSSPAIGADGIIYFGSHDKNFYALSPDGKLRWKFSTNGQITSSAAIGPDGVIYFTSTDGNFYALNPDGTEKWRFHTGGANESSPVLGINNDVYASFTLTNGGHLTCLDLNGKFKWNWTTADVWNDTTPIVLANGDVYFSWPWMTLVGVRPDHPIVESIQFKDNVSSSPSIAADGTLYFTCGRDLFAVATTNSAPQATSSWPMFRANPQHTGRVAVQ